MVNGMCVVAIILSYHVTVIIIIIFTIITIITFDIVIYIISNIIIIYLIISRSSSILFSKDKIKKTMKAKQQ